MTTPKEEILRRIELEQMRLDLGITGTMLTLVSGASMWKNASPLGKAGLAFTAIGGTLTTIAAWKSIAALKAQLT